MRNFWIILKTNLINTFKLNKLNAKSKRDRVSIWMILLFIFIVILFFGIAFMYLFMFGEALAKGGAPELILDLGLFAGAIFSILVTLNNAGAYIFRARDFDLLMSLPVKPQTVVASKLAYLLLMNYLTFALIYLPTIIVYAIFNQTNYVFWLTTLPTFILLPLLPVTVASFISYLFSLIAPRFKYKNFFAIILSISFIIFIMFISFRSQMIYENPEAFTANMNKILKITGQLAYNGMRGDLLSYLIFTAISIVPFSGFVYFVGIYYLRSNTRFNSAYTNKGFKMTEMETSSQNKTLIKKEVKRYFGSNMYVLNTIMGPILSVIMIVLTYLSSKEMIPGNNYNINELGIFPLILVGIVTFTLGITSTTSASISIEGKQFWILKSAPITSKQVFDAKIFVNLLITIPFVIIDVILSKVLFHLEIIDLVFMLIIPIIAILFMSYIGLYLNLLFPRFDYESDVKAVKQSISVLLTMVAGFLFSLIMIVMAILGITKLKNITLTYLIAIMSGLILMTLSITLTYKHGNKLYHRLNA